MAIYSLPDGRMPPKKVSDMNFTTSGLFFVERQFPSIHAFLFYIQKIEIEGEHRAPESEKT